MKKNKQNKIKKLKIQQHKWKDWIDHLLNIYGNKSLEKISTCDLGDRKFNIVRRRKFKKHKGEKKSPEDTSYSPKLLEEKFSISNH